MRPSPTTRRPSSPPTPSCFPGLAPSAAAWRRWGRQGCSCWPTSWPPPEANTMELFPAIDLRAGRCVRLWQGDFDKETVYGTDPVAVARAFCKAGARWLHVVDLDAARGEGSNLETVLAIARAVPAQVQTGGGVRDDALLLAGVERVVLGSLAVANRAYAAELVAEYPGRVAVGLDQ